MFEWSRSYDQDGHHAQICEKKKNLLYALEWGKKGKTMHFPKTLAVYDMRVGTIRMFMKAKGQVLLMILAPCHQCWILVKKFK